MSAPTPTCPAGSVFTHYMQQAGGFCSAGGLSLGSPRCPAGFVWNPAEATAENRTNTAANIGTCVEDPAATSAQQQAAAAAAAETAQKAVDTYTLSFTGLQRQLHQLQDTQDLMAQAHGLYSGVSDDLHYSINQLSSKTSDLQNEINITNRKVAAPTWWPWLDMFLNVLLVLVLLYALYVVVIKLMYVHPVVTQIQTPY